MNTKWQKILKIACTCGGMIATFGVGLYVVPRTDWPLYGYFLGGACASLLGISIAGLIVVIAWRVTQWRWFKDWLYVQRRKRCSKVGHQWGERKEIDVSFETPFNWYHQECQRCECTRFISDEYDWED